MRGEYRGDRGEQIVLSPWCEGRPREPADDDVGVIKPPYRQYLAKVAGVGDGEVDAREAPSEQISEPFVDFDGHVVASAGQPPLDGLRERSGARPKLHHDGVAGEWNRCDDRVGECLAARRDRGNRERIAEELAEKLATMVNGHCLPPRSADMPSNVRVSHSIRARRAMAPMRVSGNPKSNPCTPPAQTCSSAWPPAAQIRLA